MIMVKSFVESKTYADHVRWMRMRRLSRSTIAGREHALRRLAAWCDGTPLAGITEDQLLSWADSLEAEGLSPGSRYVFVSHVRSYYAWAYDEEHYQGRNPARRLPLPKMGRRLPRPMSEDKVAAALKIASPYVRVWLELAGWAGLRACEVAGLRGENVHLSGAEPYIHVTADATKGVRERIVQLHPEVAAELRVSHDWPDSGPCFRKLDGDPFPANLVSKMANQTLHQAGIGDTFHSLRHRFGTVATALGHDLRTTQLLMGHASPVTTAGYAAVSSAEARRVAELIPPPIPRRKGPDAA